MLEDSEYAEFEISGFRDRRQNGMIGRRTPPLEHLQAPSSPTSGVVDNLLEDLRENMMRTG